MQIIGEGVRGWMSPGPKYWGHSSPSAPRSRRLQKRPLQMFSIVVMVVTSPSDNACMSSQMIEKKQGEVQIGLSSPGTHLKHLWIH